MIDQLIIGNTASYADYDANVKERTIAAPKKKSIKQTVPFSNKTYDFSAINGEIYWDERTLEYVFEITADTPEKLEKKKQGFVSWIMNVMGEPLHDPFIRDYHFIATYDDSDIDDTEIEKSTITVKFSAYPYMIANKATVYEHVISSSSDITFEVENHSSHRLIPTITITGSARIVYGDSSYAIGAGTYEREAFMLNKGVNAFYVENLAETAVTITVSFHEEVF